ncbi:protein kinase [Aureococcus anophagefferens]|nr:protein kinase [Aureococcus anophagefferens]
MAANRRFADRAPSEAIVVGQFDSISETSQSQYCSVGRWTGMRNPGKALARVGDGGLCSRVPDRRHLRDGFGRELFVGGAFSSRVWDGAHFVKVEHVARFDSRRNLWMPLRGGSPSLSAPCGSKPASGPGNASAVSVLALAYLDGALFVGGRFDALGAPRRRRFGRVDRGRVCSRSRRPLASDGAGRASPTRWPSTPRRACSTSAASSTRSGRCRATAAFPWKGGRADLDLPPRRGPRLRDVQGALQLLYDGAALFVAGYPAEGGACGAARRAATTSGSGAAGRAATWEWLPGWRGANGTVLALAPGVGASRGPSSSAATDGDPPVVVWRRDDTLGPYTMGFAGVGPLGGTAAFAGGAMHRRDIIEEIVGEAGIMAYLRHPKILQLWLLPDGAGDLDRLELCSHGSLRSVLDDASLELGLETRLRMAIDVAEGMLYLHTRDHPILIKGAKGSERIDVYAFGIVLWELATREEVYGDLSAAQIISRVANEGLRPEPPQNCPWGDLMAAGRGPRRPPGLRRHLLGLNRIHEELTGDVLERAPGPAAEPPPGRGAR